MPQSVALACRVERKGSTGQVLSVYMHHYLIACTGWARRVPPEDTNHQLIAYKDSRALPERMGSQALRRGSQGLPERMGSQALLGHRCSQNLPERKGSPNLLENRSPWELVDHTGDPQKGHTDYSSLEQAAQPVLRTEAPDRIPMAVHAVRVWERQQASRNLSNFP